MPAKEVAARDDVLEREATGATIHVHLVTARGEATIAVPAQEDWRSRARHALFTVGDDYTWAQQTLAPDDFATWAELNPTGKEVDGFLREYGSMIGLQVGESRASQRSSKSTARR